MPPDLIHFSPMNTPTQPYNSRSISDDDLCACCSHLAYNPGEQSTCDQNWPGTFNADGYCATCPAFKCCKRGANIVQVIP